MKKEIWSIFLVLITMACLLTSGCVATDTLANNTETQITFTDLAEREVTLDSRPETIAVGFYIANYLMVGGDEALDRLVGLAMESWDSIRYGEHAVFTSTYPKLLEANGEIVNIGSYHDDTLNTEKILQLKPDVLLLSPSQYSANNEQVKTYENAGIKVVVVNFNANTLEAHTRSNRILGMILGKEDVAEEQIAAYTAAVNDIASRLAGANVEKKVVYVELGNKGPGDYGNSYSNTMWGSFVTQAGGINIADGQIEKYGSLNPEYVIASNPDAIFIGGSIWSGDTGGDQMRMGYTISEETARERLKKFTERPGWNAIAAVKEGEVYGVDHGGLRTMIDYAYLQYIAKALYPELFEDLDPQTTMEEFYEKYLPDLDYTGTFMIKLDTK